MEITGSDLDHYVVNFDKSSSKSSNPLTSIERVTQMTPLLHILKGLAWIART